MVEGVFYAKFEDVNDKCLAHDAEIVLEDLNAKVGQEGIFGNSVEQFSLHANTISIGIRLIDFAAVVCSTKLWSLTITRPL